ncbi:hypothetical protein P775_17490 [Puniceibacterium antarcticum]|uniref:Uncharacterized protein n=1 Tax=Puniceibacterium antarcticum TaxID=1206336 RepID=A0A2G8RB94_9RHOB|nr:hypothetical protein [Puniceibacterium antarcticum]PIL18836.1 hypothetical protein P775_17490 [Puniceibacterium antarcticum]
MTWAGLATLDADQRDAVTRPLMGGAGAPLPTFLNPMTDARWWASCASRSELKAYALAAYEAMSAKDQTAFFRHIGEVEIAL